MNITRASFEYLGEEGTVDTFRLYLLEKHLSGMPTPTAWSKKTKSKQVECMFLIFLSLLINKNKPQISFIH